MSRRPSELISDAPAALMTGVRALGGAIPGRYKCGRARRIGNVNIGPLVLVCSRSTL